MKIKDGFSRNAFVVINTVFMLFISFIMLYPMMYIIFASFSDSSELMRNGGLLFWPKGFNIESYRAVFKNPNIVNGFKNTFVILSASLSLQMLLTLLAGYVLSRKNLMLNKFFTLFMTFTMFFSGGMIPSYLIVKGLGLLDTYWSVIIPGAVNVTNVIIMRTGFLGIPDSLSESATIDGANKMTILFRILVPVLKPTIAVITLYYAVGTWNSWFNAMLYMSKARNLQPLQCVLRDILIMNDTASMESGAIDEQSVAETIKYAVIVVSTVPILLLYPFLQKYFAKGAMMGSVKG